MNYHLYNHSRLFHDPKWIKPPIKFFEDNEYPNKPRKQIGLSKSFDYFEYKGLNRANDILIKDRTDYARINIKADNKKIEIKRRYEDFMEFYANNSLLIDLINFCCILVGFYNEIFAKRALVDNLFSYGEENYIIKKEIKNILRNAKDRKNNNNFIYSGKKLNDNIITNRNPNSNIDIYNNDINSSTEIEFSRNKKDKITKKIYELNCSNKCKKCFCFCCDWNFKYKEHIIETPNDIIDKKLDIKYYIKNMFKLDLISKLEFESKQNLLNYLCSPAIEFRLTNKDNVLSKYSIYGRRDIFDDMENESSQVNLGKLSNEIKDSINYPSERNIKLIKFLKEKIKK